MPMWMHRLLSPDGGEGGGDGESDTGAGDGEAGKSSDDAGSGEGGGSGDEAPWFSVLDEDLQQIESIKVTPDLNTFARRFLEKEALVGADTVKIPGKNASDADVNTYHKAIGRPDAASEYVIPEEGMPEGLNMDDDRMVAVRDAAFKTGVSKAQFAELVRADAHYMAALGTKLVGEQDSALEAATNALKNDADFGGEAYEENVAMAKHAVMEFAGSEGAAKVIVDTGILNTVEGAKLFAAVGKALASDPIIGKGPSASFATSPALAQAKLKALEEDTKHMDAIGNKDHPDHQAAVDLEKKLHEAINPPKKD